MTWMCTNCQEIAVIPALHHSSSTAATTAADGGSDNDDDDDNDERRLYAAYTQTGAYFTPELVSPGASPPPPSGRAGGYQINAVRLDDVVVDPYPRSR